MAQTVLSLISVGVVIYALVDCWRSLPSEVRRLSRGGWAIVILVLPLIGAVAYLVLGRAPGPDRAVLTGPRMIAPDDDPEFLRALEFKRRQTLVEERRRREADEKRRKAERRDERRADRKSERTPEPSPPAPSLPAPPPQPADPSKPVAPQPLSDGREPPVEPDPDDRPDQPGG